MQTIRDYFSWSQYNLWNSSKVEFRKKYVIGQDALNNKFLEKGKMLADSLKFGVIADTDDDISEDVIVSLPKLHYSEKEIDIAIGGERILAYIDSCSEDLKLFYEYKTGKVEWTQERLDKDEQTLFYAVLLYSITGILPTVELYWAETKEVDVQVLFTGTIKKFVREFNKNEIEKMEIKILKTIQDIRNYEYEVVLVDDGFVETYLELNQRINELNQQLDAIKNVIIESIGDSTIGESNYGTFSVVKRKTYKYSDDVEKIEQEYKTVIEKLRKSERDNDIAKEEISSTYLKFKKD